MLLRGHIGWEGEMECSEEALQRLESRSKQQKQLAEFHVAHAQESFASLVGHAGVTRAAYASQIGDKRDLKSYRRKCAKGFVLDGSKQFTNRTRRIRSTSWTLPSWPS